jgi:drug/metabolite transporter (DMT)-like permease
LKKLFKNKRALIIVAFAGLLNYAGAQLFLTLGVLGTNPIITTIVLKLWPIFLAIMIPFVIKTKVEWPQIFALLIAFSGVYLILTNGTLISLNVLELPYIGFLVLSTFFTAFSNLIIKSQNNDIYSEVFVFNLASLLFIALLIFTLKVPLSLNMDLASIASILFLGMITYCVGALLFFYTLKALDPLVAANASYSTPFLTILFSFLILGTPLKIYYLYAVALIILALIIQNKYSKRAPRYIGTKAHRPLALYDITGAFVENTHPQIYQYIQGTGRALAAKIRISKYLEFENKNNYDCIVFTNKNHPDSIRKGEMEFIENIVCPGPDELIIMGIGNADSVEKAIAEYFNY